MDELLDFLYLDLPRLSSFASQLLGGLPTSMVKGGEKEAEFSGGVEGGLPFLLRGSANTKAVLSASSSVTSTVHHELVAKVVEGLQDRKLLYTLGPDDVETGALRLADGAFALLSGRLQIVDPHGLAKTLRLVVQLQQTVSKVQPAQIDQPMPINRAARRAQQWSGQMAGQQKQGAGTDQQKQFEAFAGITEAFGGDTVRVRILRQGRSIGTAAVERDKFVEDLDRLVLRHGYLTGGQWWVLAQSNTPPGQDFYEPSEGALLDLLEKGGVSVLQQVAQQSGGAATAGTLTPLAIYRHVPKSGQPTK